MRYIAHLDENPFAEIGYRITSRKCKRHSAQCPVPVRVRLVLLGDSSNRSSMLLAVVVVVSLQLQLGSIILSYLIKHPPSPCTSVSSQGSRHFLATGPIPSSAPLCDERRALGGRALASLPIADIATDVVAVIVASC